ncbi:hypothetical protein RhiirA1_479827 [Rhizophagus irregularis]|uniref:Uncharacterized protein n=1 Tax=Rhizophagus irregularis TaxID=588596 RepID=A0A2I1EIB4_9GLOM|nr:hypothetical protein RhiirA1_479827 [Rhizophagus irregularis]PKY21859.1 hypothetical protein RhiirB3_435587 [Rhizophagus irregularis]
MSGYPVNIIVDEQFNKAVTKPINNRPGYNMNYVHAYICGNQIKNIIKVDQGDDIITQVKKGLEVIANKVKPRKVYWNGWHRYEYEVKSEDLMQYHWDSKCFKAKT